MKHLIHHLFFWVVESCIVIGDVPNRQFCSSLPSKWTRLFLFIGGYTPFSVLASVIL